MKMPPSVYCCARPTFALCIFFTEDFPSVNYSLVTKDVVFTDILYCLNQFLNKSVIKSNLIDLYVCLSSPQCLQRFHSEKKKRGTGIERQSNEYLIHHSLHDLPTGLV